MTTDQLDLLRAIREQSDDDTLRMAFADELDNLDTVSVPCPKCKATGLYCRPCNNTGVWDHSHFFDLSEEEIEEHGRPTSPCPQCKKPGKVADDCEPCNGTGFVPDTTNRDRATLIRVQVELFDGTVPLTNMRKISELRTREKQLLTANADKWRAGPKCERCSGSKEIGQFDGLGYRDCPDCWGSGDAGGLMRRPSISMQGPDGDRHWLHKVEYVRGFPVVHCRVADVWEKVWQPTAWALAVCKWHPDVVAFVIEGGVINAREYGGGDDRWAIYRTNVPPDVWNMMCPGSAPDNHFVELHDRNALVTGLGNVVVRWVHSHLTPHPV